MLSVLSSTSCDNPFMNLESFVITELVMTELPVKLQNSEYEYGLDHVGGTRYCESNESRSGLCSVCSEGRDVIGTAT